MTCSRSVHEFQILGDWPFIIIGGGGLVPSMSMVVTALIYTELNYKRNTFVFALIFYELNSKIEDYFYVHKRPISLQYCSQICLNLC